MAVLYTRLGRCQEVCEDNRILVTTERSGEIAPILVQETITDPPTTAGQTMPMAAFVVDSVARYEKIG
jgi:hypothetical protein